ncbi:MAG: hypothetical protein QGG72_08255 [Verrucomicrobiota bacterium]|nr:hypothetical protein [Verrucomicrobiota bacterium]
MAKRDRLVSFSQREKAAAGRMRKSGLFFNDHGLAKLSPSPRPSPAGRGKTSSFVIPCSVFDIGFLQRFE